MRIAEPLKGETPAGTSAAGDTRCRQVESMPTILATCASER